MPWGEFFRARMTVLMPILRTRAVSRTPEPLNAIFAAFIGVGELKHVRTDGATIANMASRGITMAIYVVRVATRTVNGDGCHETTSLKDTHHTRSTVEVQT